MEFIAVIFIIMIIASVIGSKKQKKSHTNYGSFYHSTPKPKLNIKQIDIENLELSDEQQKIFEIIENSKNNVFITGEAGTGKSSLLQYFKYKSQKNLVVVAPTGVAALNIGGQTIHSLFVLPHGFLSEERLRGLRLYPKTAFLLKNIDTLVIDEISMVRADLMDAIDFRLKAARGNDLPFGGVQVVMFGDPYQLPPVVDDPELHRYFAHNHGSPYFFDAHVWKNAMLDNYKLTKIFRQKDENFINILNGIRHGGISSELLGELNQRVNVQMPSEGVVTLATTNSIVNSINALRLSKLPAKQFTYKAIIDGQLDKMSFPADEFLQLKEGAQVMFLKNDKDKRWVNGTLGTIKSLSENEVKVDIDGITYSVAKETWNKVKYYYNQQERKIEEEVVSSFTQYPLRLAWAVTVHKSQGQTYNSIAVDMGDGAFAHGQTYVALSRCRTLEGLYLKREILKEDVIVDPVITKFMDLAKVVEII